MPKRKLIMMLSYLFLACFIVSCSGDISDVANDIRLKGVTLVFDGTQGQFNCKEYVKTVTNQDTLNMIVDMLGDFSESSNSPSTRLSPWRIQFRIKGRRYIPISLYYPGWPEKKKYYKFTGKGGSKNDELAKLIVDIMEVDKIATSKDDEFRASWCDD